MKPTTKEIKTIEFPNTATGDSASYYRAESGYNFERVLKNGEMAGVTWIQVWKGSNIIAEIKESVCNLYF